MKIEAITGECDRCGEQSVPLVAFRRYLRSVCICKECLNFALLVLKNPDAHKYEPGFGGLSPTCKECNKPLGNPIHYQSW